MNRDSVKTFVGLVIIGGIVVATFLYGNAQRQAQLAHDQEVKKQQEIKASEQAKKATASASPAGSPSTAPVAAGTSTSTPTPTKNTAPVTSPATNTIQGTGGSGSVAGTAATPKAATPAATPATTPTTGGTTAVAPLPDTGPEALGAIGLGSITVAMVALRRSRMGMLKAARRIR